ncbi:MAG: ribosome-associated translation inhibitor RaiA [Lentisphaeraceae bacterium]|nr:ribosome-associated translation inhibitor RaiA [Lentisphaeraceae bacterium]
MNVIVSSRHFKLHPKTRKDIEYAMQTLDNYHWKLNRCEVVLNSVHKKFHVEILLRGKGINIEAKYEDSSLYRAFVETFDRLTTQLKKCKDRQKKHQAVHLAMIDLISAEMEERREEKLTA